MFEVNVVLKYANAFFQLGIGYEVFSLKWT
jgi:hypothetical protein